MIIGPFSLKKRGRFWHYCFHVNKRRYRGTTKAVSKELAIQFTNKLYLEIYQRGYGLSTKIRIKDFIAEHIRQGQNSLSLQWLYTKELILSEFLNFTAREGVESLDEIKLKHLERYKAFRLERNKKRFLSREEIEVVLNATKGTYLENFVLVAVCTGLRRRELIHLEFSDVDFERHLLYVRNKEGFQTKSRKERVVPLHIKLWPFFEKKRVGLCFPYRGRLIQEDTASRNFKEMVTKVGLKDVGLHTLRHTFISLCLRTVYRCGR